MRLETGRASQKAIEVGCRLINYGGRASRRRKLFESQSVVSLLGEKSAELALAIGSSAADCLEPVSVELVSG